MMYACNVGVIPNCIVVAVPKLVVGAALLTYESAAGANVSVTALAATG
jgi:hypothetical protein